MREGIGEERKWKGSQHLSVVCSFALVNNQVKEDLKLIGHGTGQTPQFFFRLLSNGIEL